MEETQTPESKKNETSSEQRMDYQRNPKQMDETAADNSESVGLPYYQDYQEQQKTEEDDDYVKVSVDDVPPSKTYLFHSKEALSLNGKQRQQISRSTT